MATVMPEREHAEWMERRREGVGSSDTPAILGVDPRYTRLAVYLEKTGRSRPEPEREHHWWGLALEPVIFQAYERRTGREVIGRQVEATSETYPWLRATYDGVRDDGRIVEAKSLGAYAATQFNAADGDWEALPPHWIVQVTHQMIVSDTDVADVAVFYPLELRVYTVPRSERLASLIVDMTTEFWEDVCDGNPPRTLDPRDEMRLALAYPRAEGDICLIGGWLDELCIPNDGKVDDARSRTALLDAMGNFAVAYLPNGQVVRRRVKTTKAYTVPSKTKVEVSIEGRNPWTVDRAK